MPSAYVSNEKELSYGELSYANYHINGVFLASMAIHESGWGTSTIAKDKKNLFF